ncbi:MAG: gamma-glutamyltransferase [Elainellaceae cyanobacterium]
MRNFHLPGRSPVYGTRGVAATSHPQATLTAMAVLSAGGNAVDAAIAASAMLCVVEPQSTGIGGDCFALYAPAFSSQHAPAFSSQHAPAAQPKPGKIIALNGSGRSPRAATLDYFTQRGLTRIERHSPHAVTVPGAVDAWCRLSADYGQLPLGKLLQPAIETARGGYPIYPRVAADWGQSIKALQQSPAAAQTFLPNGQPPQVGQIHCQPHLARTLEAIAQEGRDAFYAGEAAQHMVSYLNELGGLHTLEDFAVAASEYVTPISTEYRGCRVFECPPNGQGLTALLMLNILSHFDLASLDPHGPERYHLMAEAARLAYRDRDRYIADPALAKVPVEALLSTAYADRLGQHISPDRAMAALPPSQFPAHPDTVYLCVVDAAGNAISFINSVFHAFGSGLMCPQTGVVFQSRGAGFSLEPGHPNAIAPRKRPLHTIIPGMLVKEGQVVMPFGVMGGEFQPMGHALLLTNLLDYGMDVQEALDCPRVFSGSSPVCQLEQGIVPEVARGLRARGHKVQDAPAPLGGGQAVWIDPNTGLRTAGSDPRKDGCALAQ